VVTKSPLGYLLNKDFDRWRCGFSAEPVTGMWRPNRDEMDTHPVTNQARTPCPDDHAPRDEMDTVPMPESTLVVDRTQPLEPVRTNESQVEPPKAPQGASQFSLIIDDAPKPDPVLEVLAGYMEGRPAKSRPDENGDFRVKVEARLARKGKGRSKTKGPECTPQDLADLSRWVLKSPGRDAELLREGGHDGYGTIYKPTRMEERLISMRAWRDEGAIKGTPSKAVAPTEADGSARLSYQSWSWFEGELSTRARERNLAPEQVCAAWAKKHKEAANVPAWAFDRAVANVRKERT
jgi:hypothetical protein